MRGREWSFGQGVFSRGCGTVWITLIIYLAWELTLIKDGLDILLTCAIVITSALSIYLLLLAAASLRARRQAGGALREPTRGGHDAPSTRFAILIPAHE